MTNIRTYRERLGLTQAQLAERTGVERTVVTHWEIGDTNPRIEKLPVLADALGVTIDELLREPEKEGT